MDYNVDTRLLQELNQLKLLKIKIINPGSLLITLINDRYFHLGSKKKDCLFRQSLYNFYLSVLTKKLSIQEDQLFLLNIHTHYHTRKQPLQKYQLKQYQL